jgi:adenine-specific DNA-methyltransferase
MKETNLNGESKDVVTENIQQLKELFPEVFAEDSIDFEKLKAVLGEYADEDDERYNFTWWGKSRALRLAQTPSTGTLRPCSEESKDWDTTQNLYIEGDNLEVLKLLQKTYHNKVKMIYIDPPYNTGNDFVYPDDYRDGIKNYKEITKQVDDEGHNISTNSESDGRYHTKWLNMMYPRLRLARNLLRDDGVIFISIDDNELDNLHKICKEIFGDDNYINTISIKAKASSGASGGGEDRRLKKNIEYILVFSKSEKFSRFETITKSQAITDYISERAKKGIGFAYNSILIDSGVETYHSTIKAGDGNDIVINKVTNYKISSVNSVMKDEKLSMKDVYYKYFDKIFTTENAQTSIRTRVVTATGKENEFYNIYYFPISGKNKGQKTCVGFIGKTKRLVSFLSNVAEKNNNEVIKKDKIGTLWDDLSWSSIHLEGEIKFNNGKKPIAMLNRLLEMYAKDGDTVLDFFAGSSSTAHAVINKNSENNEKQKFIMVQIPESFDKNEPALKNGYKNICEIGKERIRRAGDKIKAELREKYDAQQGQILVADEDKVMNPDDLDIGFKVFKLDSSNLKKWNPDADDLDTSLFDNIENFVEGRGELGVVYEIMLKYGIDLKLPIEEFKAGDNTIFSVGLGALMICLDNEITTEVAQEIVKLKAKLSPEVMRVVFKDNGFKNDSAKTNTKEILRTNGVDEIVSI